jgi:hypothetical protein
MLATYQWWQLFRTVTRNRSYSKFLPYLVGNYPTLFYPLNTLYKGKETKRAVRHDTEITIEGFPRSGNSFAVCAFKFGQQRPVAVAHHMHVPAQVIQSVRFDIPTCVLIRQPEEAIRSMVLKYPGIPLRFALLGYALFYETCMRYQGHFVAASFEQVVADFGAVIDRINARFATRFARFEHTPSNVERVFAFLDRKADKAVGGRVYGSFRPHPAKERAKREIILAAYPRLFSRCLQIYRRFNTLT